jgi:CMP/dCMP kinase
VIIAIDGPAASGKGTLGRRLAAHFGLAHLDTGMLYRAVALRVLEAGGDPADEAQAAAAARAVRSDDLGRPGLRDERISAASSKVAVHPSVRHTLLEFQRNFARRPPGGAKGAVLDGRDIGTVICPEPDVIKFYISAGMETRARRRLKELQEKGDPAIYPAVLQDMKERDARDANRGVAALKRAPDAFEIDTSNLDADQVFAAALRFIEQKNRATG